jgi:hypothetical protein
VAQRGVYNSLNTPHGSGAPVNNGVNFGFGVNGGLSAQQTIDRYDQRDRQARLDQRANADRRNYDALASTLGDRDTSTADKRIVLKQMEMSQHFGTTDADRAQGQAGGLLGAQVTRETAVAKQGAAIAAAQAAVQGRLAEVNLSGQYGLQSATIRADGRTAAAVATGANSAGTQALATQNAALAATRLARLNAKIKANTATDQDFLDFTSGSPSRPGRTAYSPIDGHLLTPEEQDLYSEQNVNQLNKAK